VIIQVTTPSHLSTLKSGRAVGSRQTLAVRSLALAKHWLYARWRSL